VNDHIGMIEPNISVVIPAFNAERWIAETLRSVIRQTFAPERYEILVVDNGSEDRTRDIASRILADAAVRSTITIEHRRGPAHARNHGLYLARGAWVQLVDADDLLHADKLRRQYECAQEADARIGAVYSAWQRLEPGQETEWIKGPPLMPRLDNTSVSAQLNSLLDADGFIQTGGQLFRRTALLDVGGYRDVGLIEDVDLYIRLTIAGWKLDSCPSPEPLFAYRRHRMGSLSTGNQLAFSEGVARNAAMVEDWARAHHALDEVLSARIADCYFHAARGFAGRDWQRFDVVVARIKSLVGPVIPPGPRVLAILSSMIGYRAAEHVAVSWRMVKRAAGWA
jgi:glycosyltransferase involved in cell wall biosynthesis